MTALRVGFDTGPLLGPRTGVGLAVQEMHRALGERDDLQLTDYVLSLRARLGGKVPQGTRILPLPAAVAQRIWAISDRARLDRWLPGVQVVHGTNYVVPPSNLPRVVSVYDCWFLRHPDQATPSVHRAGQVLRRAVASGAVVHASSTATADEVRSLLPGASVHTVHLAAVPLTPAPANAPTAAAVTQLAGRPFVLFIGTFERRKNLPMLVQAFAAIASSHPDLCLVLAGGEGDDSAAVQRAVSALGPALSPRVLLAGRVDTDTRSWLLHRAAALAYPSLDEGFGFPLLDAMQASVPVVASTAGSIPEVAGDAALLSDVSDLDAFAENLHLALHSQSVRAHLVATGHEQWQRFSWHRCAAEMSALYRRVAAGEFAAGSSTTGTGTTDAHTTDSGGDVR